MTGDEIVVKGANIAQDKEDTLYEKEHDYPVCK
jgi:hypothetical protein